MSENKKILNATPTVASDGTPLKSKMEKMVYETLLKSGLSPRYEQETFTYWQGIRPTVPFYDLGKNRRLRYNMTKFIDMKYTPDFVFDYEGVKVVIEAKGHENDQFPIRKKLFRAYLETVGYPVVFAEIFTKKQLLEFIDILKANSNKFKNVENDT